MTEREKYSRLETVCATLLGTSVGAYLGANGWIPELVGILSGPIIGALIAAAQGAVFEGFDALPIRFVKMILGALVGIISVAILFGLFFGAYAIIYAVLDNPVTGPMLEWFPTTMENAVGALVIPAVVGIVFWLFFRETNSLARPFLFDIQGVALYSFFGIFIGAATETPFLLILFPVGYFLNGWEAGVWSGIAGGVIGGLYGYSVIKVMRFILELWGF